MRGNYDSRGNESCDISPDHDGSGRRHVAGGAGQYAASNFVEEVNEADISSINPLATDRDRGQGRCSLFEEEQ